MSKVVVAYHSGYGHTEVIAKAVAEGASAQLVDVSQITEEQWGLLDEADAIIFGSPTYMATASAAFHKFAEDSSKRWFTQAWKDKVAGGFTVSGAMSGDKLSTLNYFQSLAGQHAMIWVSLGQMPGWNSSQGSINDQNRLGFYSGLGVQVNTDQGADGVLESDIATARDYGKRIAEIASKLA